MKLNEIGTEKINQRKAIIELVIAIISICFLLGLLQDHFTK